MGGGFAIGIDGRLRVVIGGGFRSLWVADLVWNTHHKANRTKKGRNEELVVAGELLGLAIGRVFRCLFIFFGLFNITLYCVASSHFSFGKKPPRVTVDRWQLR